MVRGVALVVFIMFSMVSIVAGIPRSEQISLFSLAQPGTMMLKKNGRISMRAGLIMK